MNNERYYAGIQKYVRAMRLPFLAASILPFVLGSFLYKGALNLGYFLLGLGCVVLTHLGANLINDYADSKSGVDWQDRKWYNFFGGSKLIQEGILPERFYLSASIFCFSLAFAFVLLLSVFLKHARIIGYYSTILFLGYSYSHKPLRLSYRRLGEPVIFLLFGPALVMGASFMQGQPFPELRSFMLSLPFGFFTTAILFANEIPDYQQDVTSGKHTWVGITGQDRAFILYYVLVFLGFISVVVDFLLGYLGILSLLCLVLIVPCLKAGSILKNLYGIKQELIRSSQIVITVQLFVSLILLADILI